MICEGVEPQINTDKVVYMPRWAVFSLCVFIGCLPAPAKGGWAMP